MKAKLLANMTLLLLAGCAFLGGIEEREKGLRKSRSGDHGVIRFQTGEFRRTLAGVH